MLSSIFLKKGTPVMLVKRIKTKTRPSTDISFNWDSQHIHDDIVLQLNELNYRSVESGLIAYISDTMSEDALTLTQEMQFTSIQNCIDYDKQLYDLDYSNGSLLLSLQYFLDNGITHTVSYVFEK